MKRRTLRGLSIVESLVASVISSMVLFVAISAYLAGMGSWARGESWIDVQQQSRNSVRVVSDKLREAMAVLVDLDGMGLTYKLPAKDSSGAFVVPLTWDGVTRRIYYSNGNLYTQDGLTVNQVATGIITIDPFLGADNARTVVIKNGAYSAPSYKIFSTDGSVNPRSVIVCVVTKSRGKGAETIHARHRETIFLRNLPSITK
ncbi:MAG: hypothetical protein KF857_01425 [Fimbriimonadaceae bacterium]|nr:hypothetical protein [Fimbriimonadaceae bacterium]